MVENLLIKIGKNLDGKEIPYMIIGGQAVLLYGTPRLTRDIDITLGIDTDSVALIKELCGELKLKILPENPDEFARDTNVLPAEDARSKIRVDFIFSFTDYEKQAIKRAKRVSMKGYPVKFASCEDLIIHKLFAGRAIDEEDVKNILIKRRKSVNIKYIKKWLLNFSKIPGQKSLPKRFKNILKGDVA